MSIKTISVIGLGYIGLPTAAVLAARGIQVIGVDISEKTVATINRGEIHIIEPDLDGLVSRVVADGLLRATTQVEPADAFLIAVPTPFKDGHEPDLAYVEKATRSIAPVLKPGDVVVLESTSPVGATECVVEWLAEERPDLVLPRFGAENQVHDIFIAHCPERVLPGNVLHELVHNDRVIGGITPACSDAAAAVYSVFVSGECILTDARTAEMCKLAENSFRDVNIAFANELSMICDRLAIDVWRLIELANRHPRVNVLQPGPGVGGHCIAVDPWFIVHSAPQEARLIRQAREVNNHKETWVKDKIGRAIADLLAADPERRASDVKVACFGLSFKANIDDLRESPALDIAKSVASSHPGPTLAVEPHISCLPEDAVATGLELVAPQRAFEEADILVLLVDHSMFRQIAAEPRPGACVIDTRGIWTHLVQNR